uniref:A-kinase anchor protein SPHKAP n=1 Tax=Lygus hesperus TaxID=30085 RepID=A0A0A9ZER1_LYGHE
MGHQYRMSALSDELGMRRIFPIVLIRGIRVPRLDTLFNHQGVRPEEPDAADESDERPVSSGPSQVRRSSSRIAQSRRSRRNKRTLPSQPLRRSPRLNKGVS